MGAMKGQLASMIVPQLIQQLDGSTMTVTGKEMYFVLQNGTGRAETYTVIDRPAKDHWQVKTSEGKVESYFREGIGWVHRPVEISSSTSTGSLLPDKRK
jgi:hypothetical protein